MLSDPEWFLTSQQPTEVNHNYKMKTEEKPFQRIMVELQNGMMVSITDLPKEHYEYFLELVVNLNDYYKLSTLFKPKELTPDSLKEKKE